VDPRLDEAVNRARIGDHRAFRILTEALAPDLIRFLTFFLSGDSYAAHDVVQDTLIAVWDVLPEIRDLSHLRRWCYRVARCKAITWMRRRSPPGRKLRSLDAPRPDGLRYEHPAPEVVLLPEIIVEDGPLGRALSTLAPRYAVPIHLHYVRGCTTRETAELLGLKRTTVKMRLHRARALLRRALEAEERDASIPSIDAPPAKRRSKP